ncbi:MAG: family 16 glycosylhydrolase [SAR324 cluster bacterium]|nr:family 16 glycosylhydrolase [SAR324 cluster bacterium]
MNQKTVLYDNFTAADSANWVASDGWANGSPFWVGWTSDQVSYSANHLKIQLDDTGCPNSCSDEDYASGELQSLDTFGEGTFQVSLKAVKADGVVTAFFLYTGASEGTIHDEIDIEFLGKDTTQVQFNYFVDSVGGHEEVIDLGFDASLALHTYTIRRTATSIIWSVDGVAKHSVTATAAAPLPQSDLKVILNFWAGTGVDSWLNAFSYTSTLEAQFEWVRVLQ